MSRDAKHWALRVLFYFLGCCVSAMGIAMAIRSDLGVSPVNSVAYLLSLALKVDIGFTTYGVFFIIVLLQLLLLRRGFKALSLLQIPAAAVFSLFVSTAKRLTELLPDPGNYWIQVMYLLLGIALCGIGMALYLATELPALPPDCFIHAVMKKWPRLSFSSIKIPGDIFMVAVSAGISLIAFGTLVGIREGTVISAVCIGIMYRLAERAFGGELRGLLFPNTKEECENGQTDRVEASHKV